MRLTWYGCTRSTFIPFVEEQLGYAAMHELSSVWQAAMMPIREDDSGSGEVQICLQQLAVDGTLQS